MQKRCHNVSCSSFNKTVGQNHICNSRCRNVGCPSFNKFVPHNHVCSYRCTNVGCSSFNKFVQQGHKCNFRCSNVFCIYFNKYVPHNHTCVTRLGGVVTPSGSLTTIDISGEDFKKRKNRLSKGQKPTFYHQTDEEAAKKIIASQKMLRGSTGMAGGGIYFALSKEDTEGKARKKGVVLCATVLLGNTLTISSSGDRSITFTNLLSKGYDSVLIPRLRKEYVVYNSDQVKNIRKC